MSSNTEVAQGHYEKLVKLAGQIQYSKALAKVLLDESSKIDYLDTEVCLTLIHSVIEIGEGVFE